MATEPKYIQVHGHRGCRGLLPENTIPAFLRAAALGVDALELDVVITGDAQVLVSHEPWFASEYCLKPDGSGITPAEETELNIFRLPYSAIKQYDCGSKPHPRFPDQQNKPAYKPLLTDVIDSVTTFCQERSIKCPYFNIEIKSTVPSDNLFHPEPEVFTELLLDVLAKYNLTDKVMVQSFDVRPLQVLHRLKTNVKLGLLTEDDTPAEKRLEQLGFIPYAYNPNYSLVSPDLIKLLHAKSIKCFVWTVNGEDIVQKMLAFGVDGIITDYPEMVLNQVKSSYISTKTS
ncbi:glycerophosphodiester phosphodiesterase [Pontibacter sp. KCTC 32443]|uniref:glycerophosphodiester phosphodiesterase family protein n=1 Tax=Pontibacter TaxID=323449 RepID=UPI00164D4918|nr:MULTISPECIES: glycerophosphodiester phosphodiesterase family protein [Pontibacter]MBC5774560.1 glycerophosphodiester phosphodiesterase [Pontibacter sp. KCTC 32443]